MVSGSTDQTLRVWSLVSGEQTLVIGTQGIATSLAVSNKEQYVVSGGEDGEIKLWASTTGELIKILQGHSEAVWSLAVSKSGRYVASGSSDSTARVWSLDSGK